MFQTNVTARTLAYTLPIVLGFAWLGFIQPVTAQGPPDDDQGVCLGCIPGCELAEGGDTCDAKGPGGIGFSGCRVTDSPTGNCFCVMEGELCEVPDNPEDPSGMALQNEVLDAVGRGEMLPADGIFYVAARSEELIGRRKCDGSEVGRVAIATVGIPSSVRTG